MNVNAVVPSAKPFREECAQNAMWVFMSSVFLSFMRSNFMTFRTFWDFCIALAELLLMVLQDLAHVDY